MSKKNCSFNSDWLKDSRFCKWIAIDTSSAMKARCTFVCANSVEVIWTFEQLSAIV